MIKHYFKQAWNLLRQEKLFSGIYILGTGLSITVVMVLSIVFYIKIANIYPETNRDRILVVQKASEINGDNWRNASLSYPLIETCFQTLNSAEAVTAISRNSRTRNHVQLVGSEELWRVTVLQIDNQFWTVFPFRFVDGKPFTEADFQSGIPTAVIAESLALRLFGTVQATGKTVSLNFKSYRVCGVVKDASFVTDRTYAQLWIPFSVNPDYKKTWGTGGFLGNLEVYILAPSASEVEQVRAEAIDHINRYNQSLGEWKLSVKGQPDRHWQSLFRSNLKEDTPDFMKLLAPFVFVFLILLLVPSVSLSGMTESRMERRIAEMGVRRAFGARAQTLMWQIVTENFLFTVLGGLVGLLFSYLFILLGRNWIMQLGQTYVNLPPEGTDVVFFPSMLINFPVFAITLGVCFLLNLLSALIPAWRASHHEIFYSLNAK
jgi:putative ABC transport system permease protein